MKKYLLFILIIFNVFCTFGQNIINNSDFETGTIPTAKSQVSRATGWIDGCYGPSADLFDSRSNCPVGIPINTWANRNVRATGFRYVGISQIESVLGILSQPLVADCPYYISAYACGTDGWHLYCDQPYSPQYLPVYPTNTLEAVLRVAGNCTLKKVITLSGFINTTTWQNHSAIFTLTAADVANGYNRIEFRLVTTTGGTNYTENIFLDDVDLHSQPYVLQTSFSLNSTYCYCGLIYLVPNANTNPANTNHQWYIYESDYAGNQIGSQTLIGSNANCTLNTCSLTKNKYYTVKHGCWFACSPWTESRKTFYLAAPPTANAGADKIICNGQSTQIGVTMVPLHCTFNWTGSNIISGGNQPVATVAPTTTTTYTFQVTNQYGCIATDAVVVTVINAITNANISVSGNTVCSNQINLTANNNNATSYLWSNGSTSQSISVNNPTSPTQYFVTISNTCGSQVLSYTVNPNLYLSGPPHNSSLFWNNTITPNCSVHPPFIVGDLGQMTDPSYNAFTYILTFFDRWDGIVYSKTVYNPAGLYNGQITWDGVANVSTSYNWFQVNILGYNNTTAGLVVPENIYTWQLELINCTNDEVVKNGEILYVLPCDKNSSINPDLKLITHDLKIDENSRAKNTICIYPNPTSGEIIIQMNGMTGKISLRVLTLEGKIVYSEEFTNSIELINKKVDLSSLSKGVYMINIQNNENTITKKLIVD
jgi:hypothetical protein